MVAAGVSCKKQDLHCEDRDTGTLAWNEKDTICSRTHAVVYAGTAQLYESMDNGSQIVVIGNEESGTFVGMPRESK